MTIEYESVIAATRLTDGGPHSDDIKAFPHTVMMSMDGDDGMDSEHGQGSGGIGNRSNSSLWDE